jgi:hypothetical protein
MLYFTSLVTQAVLRVTPHNAVSILLSSEAGGILAIPSLGEPRSSAHAGGIDGLEIGHGNLAGCGLMLVGISI